MKQDTHIPKDLAGCLEEVATAIILAERGPKALDDKPRRRIPRWAWAAVPALAAASLAAVFFFVRPAPLPPETAAAFAQFESAFDHFADAMQTGMDTFSTPYHPTL